VQQELLKVDFFQRLSRAFYAALYKSEDFKLYGLTILCKKSKGSPYSINERRVLELIPVLDGEPAGDTSHKPGGRLPLLSTRPAVTLATLKRAATSFAAS